MSEKNWDEEIIDRWFSYPKYEGALDLLKEHQQIRMRARVACASQA